jgi:putative PIN family toxin of toxin-antitoxin system
MGARRLVLDTNVLLDLWLFDDPAVRPLRQALECGHLQALHSAACDTEFAEVLARNRFGLDAPSRERLLARWAACSALIEVVSPAPLTCSDPDDQPFLDAAFSARASALLTRDKALLQLAPRAAAAGLVICTPAATISRGELACQAS